MRGIGSIALNSVDLAAFGAYIHDNLMNQLSTHQSPMELNAMNIWFREGGETP